MQEIAAERFLRRPEVEAMIGIGTSGLYALMQHPNPELRLPSPVKIGHRCRWRESAIRNWMDRQVERSQVA